ncbi:MAG: hypothetical protein FD178_3672 [Ignavibacteria bacterium]|nr:MAG: hypothetical protein FD178_3672 [Ignavibacteria bacterium]
MGLKKGFVNGAKVENTVLTATVILKPLDNASESVGLNNKIKIKTNDWLGNVTVTAVYRSSNNSYFSFTSLMNALSSYSQLSNGGNNPCEYTDCSANNMDNLFQSQDFWNIANDLQKEDDKNWLKDNVKDSSNIPCVGAILNAMANLNNSVANALRCNTGGDPGFSSTIKSANLGAGVGGQTSASLNPGNNYPITINTYYSDASTLSRAATILHELAHAQLLALFNNAVRGGDTASQRFVLENFGYVFNNDQPITSNFAFQINNNQGHDAIAAQYIGPLAGVLYEYATSQGLSVTAQYCQDLMWSGLQNTTGYESQSWSVKTRIADAIEVERTGTNGNNDSRKGSTCN